MSNETLRKITVRAGGKCHPALEDDRGIMITCQCPGSNNGSLANRCVKIADGHDKVNCRNR